MILTETRMKKILKEEFDRRIVEILLERITPKTSDDVDVLENADQLKVTHDESGLEFTFFDILNDKVVLFVPEESRLPVSNIENNTLTGTDDNYSSYGNKDYVTVSISDFYKNFSRG